MATSASVPISTTATRLDTLPGLYQGGQLWIRNTNTARPNVLILGGPDVTASSGYALAANSQLQIGREPIYAVRATGAAKIVVGVLSVG